MKEMNLTKNRKHKNNKKLYQKPQKRNVFCSPLLDLVIAKETPREDTDDNIQLCNTKPLILINVKKSL